MYWSTYISILQGGIQLHIFLYEFKVLEQGLMNDLLSNIPTVSSTTKKSEESMFMSSSDLTLGGSISYIE
jgi:hypothetical protein